MILKTNIFPQYTTKELLEIVAKAEGVRQVREHLFLRELIILKEYFVTDEQVLRNIYRSILKYEIQKVLTKGLK